MKKTKSQAAGSAKKSKKNGRTKNASEVFGRSASKVRRTTVPRDDLTTTVPRDGG